MNKELNYDDVMLVPAFSECKSRSKIDIRTELGGRRFKSPIIPANMKTVIDEELCIELAKRGYFYIMHRFGTDSYKFVRKIYGLQQQFNGNTIVSSISVGVNGKDRELIDKFVSNKLYPDFITVDIAHGHSKHMWNMVYYIKQRLPNTFIIAGNVCTRQAAQALVDVGANAVKVGIAPGHACTTKLMTGFFRPQFSAILECTRAGWDPEKINALGILYPEKDWLEALSVPVIADGGVAHNGDIAKAMVAGATMVMAGYMLAGHDESPGEKISTPTGPVKEYFGSASEHSKEMKKHIEGKRLYIPCRGSIWDKYNQIEESLRSSCSYGGVDYSSELNKVEWRKI